MTPLASALIAFVILWTIIIWSIIVLPALWLSGTISQAEEQELGPTQDKETDTP